MTKEHEEREADGSTPQVRATRFSNSSEGGKVGELIERLHNLATAPTIAPSSVYANACREAAEALTAALERNKELEGALGGILAITNRNHVAWDAARAALGRARGEQDGMRNPL